MKDSKARRLALKPRIWYDIRDYGAKCDGSTDDTAAINAAIAAMPSIAGSFNGSASVLYIPAGRTITQGGHVVPSTKRMVLRGAGPYNSILYKKTSSTGDLLTFQGIYSGIMDLSLDGNRNGATTGDGLRLDAGTCFAFNCKIDNFTGNGITIGAGARALGCSLRDLTMTANKGYGVEVSGNFANTDGTFANVNIGSSGLSGIRIGATSGAQLLSLVHVWQSGCESTTDRAGLSLLSGNNEIVGCEFETNNGDGIRIANGVHGNLISGNNIWGNGNAGIYGFGSHRNVVSGNIIRNNAANNGAGSGIVAFAGISNESGIEWTVNGNNIFDDAGVIAAGTYAITPTYAYPGRTVVSQTFAYAESNTGLGVPDQNIVTGNQMKKERTKTGNSILNLGPQNIYANNNYGAWAVPTVASAATITLPAHMMIVQVTGTTAVTSITAGPVGRQVTLQFTDAAPGGLTDGSNLKLAGSYAATTDDTITLVSDGTNWIEVARSGNI